MRHALLGLTLLITSQVANSCTYASAGISDLYGRADALFTAVLISSREQVIPQRGQYSGQNDNAVIGGFIPLLSVFRVTRIIKPDVYRPAELKVGEFVYVLQESNTCMVGFSVDEEYLIFGARVFSNTYTTNQPTGTRLLSEAADVISELP